MPLETDGKGVFWQLDRFDHVIWRPSRNEQSGREFTDCLVVRAVGADRLHPQDSTKARVRANPHGMRQVVLFFNVPAGMLLAIRDL